MRGSIKQFNQAIKTTVQITSAVQQQRAAGGPNRNRRAVLIGHFPKPAFVKFYRRAFTSPSKSANTAAGSRSASMAATQSGKSRAAAR